MPNGHGSDLRWALPVLLLAGTIACLVRYADGHGVTWALASLVLAALCAWRFSFHATMWTVTEYGGAYTDGTAMRQARRRHRRATVVACSVAIGAVVVCLLLLR